MTDSSDRPDRSRYARVREILDQAQGPNTPDYDGHGAFWRLPLEQFVEVEVYGQRMIAPAADAGPGTDGCCGHGDASCWPTGGGSSASTGTTRSSASALITGLRGEAPFDGTVFPRLLWQSAASVSSADIAVIADWIDAGCRRARRNDH